MVNGIKSAVFYVWASVTAVAFAAAFAVVIGGVAFAGVWGMAIAEDHLPHADARMVFENGAALSPAEAELQFTLRGGRSIDCQSYGFMAVARVEIGEETREFVAFPGSTWKRVR